jgi:hypothetical protein
MENRVKELEELTASLEKQVWALTDIVQMLAEDAIERDGESDCLSTDEKEFLKSLLKKI